MPDAKTVLLVEDEEFLIILQTDWLERLGFNVIAVSSGEKAIEVAQTAPVIDLVLMDINLGHGMSGLEAASTILKDRDIPVVFLSSHMGEEIMEETKKIFASWSSSKYLDAHHGKKNVTCSACHEGKVPEQGDSVENARCLACHGDEEKLAKKTEPKDFPDRNPHKSHLGTVNCTVCHGAHKASKIYCLDCHKNFNMKIPFGEGPQAKPAAGGKVQ